MSTWTNFKRITRAGFVGFWRNAFVSISSIFVIAIALFTIASTIFSTAALDAALASLQNKVDINVYFVTTAPEADILTFKESLEALPEVIEVSYTSRDQALIDFRERHGDDQLTLQALDELGDNPLEASLSIRAKETSQYEGVEEFIAQKKVTETPEAPFISKTNFYQNKKAIESLTGIINDTRDSNFLKIIALIAVAFMVSFSTIRLAIHNSRDEIAIMRLVGASNLFISSPFVISGLLQGFIAGVMALLVVYPVLIWNESLFYPFPFFDSFDNGRLLFNFFINNFSTVFLKVTGAGLGIGAVSSFVAVRRYLKV